MVTRGTWDRKYSYCGNVTGNVLQMFVFWLRLLDLEGRFSIWSGGFSQWINTIVNINWKGGIFAGNTIDWLYFIVLGFLKLLAALAALAAFHLANRFGCQHSRHESWKWRRRFLLLFIIGEIKLAKCSRQASITDNIGSRHLKADDTFQWSGWKIQVKTGLGKKKKKKSDTDEITS